MRHNAAPVLKDKTMNSYIVNVWFGAELVASVSESFNTIAEAIAFRDSYTPETYPECHAVIFWAL